MWIMALLVHSAKILLGFRDLSSSLMQEICCIPDRGFKILKCGIYIQWIKWIN